ncbi:MAG TPA: hypothetical protein VF787_03455 [Thermoanaerobaculia bacterium]
MRKSKAVPRILRQGDVLLVAVQGGLHRPRVVTRDKDKVVLAYGEVTGHSHAIAEPSVRLTVLDHRSEMAEAARKLLAEVGLTTEIRDEDVVGVLEVPVPAELVHEEHATVPLTDEKYVVLRQREYSPEEIRQVAD